MSDLFPSAAIAGSRGEGLDQLPIGILRIGVDWMSRCAGIVGEFGAATGGNMVQ